MKKLWIGILRRVALDEAISPLPLVHALFLLVYGNLFMPRFKRYLS